MLTIAGTSHLVEQDGLDVSSTAAIEVAGPTVDKSVSEQLAEPKRVTTPTAATVDRAERDNAAVATNTETKAPAALAPARNNPLLAEQSLPVGALAFVATPRLPVSAPPFPIHNPEPAVAVVPSTPDGLAHVTAPILQTVVPPGLILQAGIVAAIVPPLDNSGSPSVLLAPNEIALQQALASYRSAKLAEAQTALDTLPSTAIERRILNWLIAVDYGDVGQDLTPVADWPGTSNVQRHRERALLRPGVSAERVIEVLGATVPSTHQGARALARAYVELGQPVKARDALAQLWRTEKLDGSVEAAIIKDFGALLTTADHRARMDRMLHADRVASAQRVATLAKSQALFAAWSAVIRKDRNALKLLDAVPSAERGAGHAFAKARFLRRTGKYKEAAIAMLAAPTDPAAYADPDSWWQERRVLSRELLDLDDAKTAYRLTAAHSAESPEMAADAEFHAGWYALRFLNDPAKAETHFARIAAFARGSTSLSRAHYWLGRTAEAAKSANAKMHFERAAAYPASFYGQLAAARLSRTDIPVATPLASLPNRRDFAARPMVKAIRALEKLSENQYADRLYRSLARSLNDPGELALLVDMASKRDLTLALRVAKTAANRGLPIGGLAHPTGVIPASADISGAGKALAYAIARQESEFNKGAVSRAGARGLLQLLPGTARDMARKAGLAFAPERLTTDAGYNATLGSAFLSDQLGRFSGSYVMTFAGYNAGPSRARDWANRYGDPRGKSVDEVVDWIERIPFTETRHYVQRVMENYQVYKMRLTGRFNIADDLVQGRKGS